MTSSTAASTRSSPLGMAALVLLSIGWIVALLLADGFELHRSAVAMPFLVAGAGCGLVEALRNGRVMWMPALLAGSAVLLYFAGRALLSPVWDLGRHDLHLIALAWLTIATVASCAGSPRRAAYLVGIITLVFLAEFAAGLYQRFVDPDWVSLRLPRRTAGGVSGLFWHWNNLAAFLALALPVFLGVVLCSRGIVPRLLYALLVAAGLLLAYYSKSRAGFAVVVIGLGAVGTALLFLRSQSWSWSARLATWSGMVLGAIAASIVIVMVVSSVSEQRGHGDDLGRALGKSSRLALAGMAFDQWMERPLVGQGSQSFKYLAIKNWDGESLEVWMGDPETVHNEYLQVLADYGLFGLLLLLAFLIVILARLVLPARREEQAPLRRALQLGAVGGLVATMAHAAIDFQLHLLPIVLFVAIAIGVLVPSARPSGAVGRGLHGVTVLAAIILSILAVGPETLAAPQWLRWQREVIRSGGKLDPSRLADLQRLVELSPHYEVALTYGQLRAREAMRNPEPDRAGLEEASRALALAYRRHPFDQTILVTHAQLLDQLGRHEEATPIHREAVRMAARRENKFGAMAGMAMNLYERGEALWMTRKPDQALGYFLQARNYLERSRASLFKFEGAADYNLRKQLLDRRISLLQDSGITPEAPRDVPPPPEER